MGEINKLTQLGLALSQISSANSMNLTPQEIIRPILSKINLFDQLTA